MREPQEITEDEMILAFIQAEASWWTDRYRASGLQPDDFGPNADTNDAEQNQRRRTALAGARGYGVNQFLFRGLPSDMTWFRGVATVGELADYRHLNYPTFVQLAGASRRVGDGARNAESVHAEGLSE